MLLQSHAYHTHTFVVKEMACLAERLPFLCIPPPVSMIPA